ncbi:MAG: FUSC family membrane protein [Hymenobacter sp.]
MGSATLLGMVLTLAHPPAAGPEGLHHAALLALGGAWYLLLALLQGRVLPYRAAQQALGECLHAVAGFLQRKAAFYDGNFDPEDDYRRLMAQQVVVNEKQEAVRDLPLHPPDCERKHQHQPPPGAHFHRNGGPV